MRNIAAIRQLYAIKEPEGVYIVSQVISYGVSSDGSKPTGWVDELPESLPQGLYIWTWKHTEYSDGTKSDEYSVSRIGIDGKGVKEAHVDYSLQETNVAPETIEVWGSFPSELKDGSWLYARTRQVYSDDNTTVSYSVSRIGVGSFYAGLQEYYANGDSNTVPPAGAPASGSYASVADVAFDSAVWVEGKKTMTAEKPYLWNFSMSFDSKGNVYVTYPVWIGNFAKGIVSIQELYATSATYIPASGREYPDDIEPEMWTDEQQDVAPTKERPYQWNLTHTTYNDGTETYVYHISAVRGKDGNNAKPPKIGSDNCWWFWSDEYGDYVSSGLTSKGDDGHNPYIGADGYWYEWQDGKYVKTDVLAQGQPGETPTISEDGYWVIGTFKTDIKAKGENPYIGENGNWWIGSKDTGIKARGDNGYTPIISSNGYWIINGEETEFPARGDDGHSPYIDAVTGTWWEWVSDPEDGEPRYIDTGIPPKGSNGKNGVDGAQPNLYGYGCELATSNYYVAHTKTGAVYMAYADSVGNGQILIYNGTKGKLWPAGTYSMSGKLMIKGINNMPKTVKCMVGADSMTTLAGSPMAVNSSGQTELKMQEQCTFEHKFSFSSESVLWLAVTGLTHTDTESEVAADIFDIYHGTYGFVKNGDVYSAENMGVNSSEAHTKFSFFCMSAVKIRMYYEIVTETNYDKFYVGNMNEEVSAEQYRSVMSGQKQGYVDYEMQKGLNTVEVAYIKDSSQNATNEKAWVWFCQITSSAVYSKGLVVISDLKIEESSNIAGVSTAYNGLAKHDEQMMQNLLDDTRDFGTKWLSYFDKNIIKNVYNGNAALYYKGGTFVDEGYSYFSVIRYSVGDVLKTNTWYTLSWWQKGVGSLSLYGDNIPCDAFVVTDCNSALIQVTTRIASTHTLSTEWEKHSVAFYCGSSVSARAALRWVVESSYNNSSNYVFITQPKLEEGDTATAWQASENDRRGDDGGFFNVIIWEDCIANAPWTFYAKRNIGGVLAVADIVIYNGYRYACILGYTATESSAVPSEDSTHWKLFQNFDNIATNIIITEAMCAKILEAVYAKIDELIVKRMMTAVSGPRIVTEGSMIAVYGEHDNPNIRFGVNEEGTAVLSFYDKYGNYKYNLGPGGIMSEIDVRYATISEATFWKIVNYSDYDSYLSQFIYEGIDVTLWQWYQGYKKIGTEYQYTAYTSEIGATWQDLGFLNDGKWVSTKPVSGKMPTTLANGVYDCMLGKYYTTLGSAVRTYAIAVFVSGVRKNYNMYITASGTFVDADGTTYSGTRTLGDYLKWLGYTDF